MQKTAMKRPYLFTLLTVGISGFVLTACGGSGKTAPGKDDTTKQKTDTLVHTNVDRKFNDYARYIAGMKIENGSALGNLNADSAYNKHCRMMDTRWAEMEKNRLSKMRAFADSELYKRLDKNDNLYYPFSGADFLHASTFFPNAKKSLYLALEQVGEFPELGKIDARLRNAYLTSIQATLSDIFRRSYFITRQMERDIPVVKGVIPVFMVFISRQGYDILNVELTELDNKGQTVVRTNNKNAIKGMRITYCPSNNPKDVRSLEYFSCDASNDGVKEHPELLAHVKGFGDANVFFKAASYLMHNPYMSQFREASLSITKAVVQDDTGFPYRVLKDNYSGYLYGTYVAPIRDFGKGGFQPDLAKLYKESGNVKKLPFSLGYHWWDNNQNYMCFVRKK